MTKLRTLKNLMPLNMTGRELFTERLLRQEAIKWIKELKSIKDKGEIWLCIRCFKDYCSCKCDGDKGKDYSNYLAEHDYESSDISGAITILKHFFNITEEDLK